MPKKKSISPTTLDLYQNFLRTLKFNGLGLDSSLTHVDRPALSEVDPTKEGPATHFNAKYRILIRDNKKFIVAAEFALMQKKKASDKKPIIAITATYTALFESDHNPSDELLKRFAESEARLIFWPYVRFFIADMSARMSIEQLLLPLTSHFDEQVSKAKK